MLYLLSQISLSSPKEQSSDILDAHLPSAVLIPLSVLALRQSSSICDNLVSNITSDKDVSFLVCFAVCLYIHEFDVQTILQRKHLFINGIY